MAKEKGSKAEWPHLCLAHWVPRSPDQGGLKDLSQGWKSMHFSLHFLYSRIPTFSGFSNPSSLRSIIKSISAFKEKVYLFIFSNFYLIFDNFIYVYKCILILYKCILILSTPQLAPLALPRLSSTHTLPTFIFPSRCYVLECWLISWLAPVSVLCNHSCNELMSVMVMSGPEDSMPQHTSLPSSSNVLSVHSFCSLGLEEWRWEII